VFPDYSASLRTAARDLDVHFHGGFEPAERPIVYGRFDVLVVPSLWPENSPFVVHEAWASGTAVVAARSGGLADLVRDGIDGLLYEPSSSQALADAVGRLLDDSTLAARLAAAAPRPKSIDRDAVEHEARYQRYLDRGRARASLTP
jgi:glycosyltransferase involved in cell wall biosynthesis